jgi:hypothetical protein
MVDCGRYCASALSARRLGIGNSAPELPIANGQSQVSWECTVAPSGDARLIDDAELKRFQTLLEAYWRAFDAAAKAAQGKELRKGPRGGGRDLEDIIRHVLGADAAYLARLTWKLEKREAEDLSKEVGQTRQAILDALAWAAKGKLPERGPRGGAIWQPRYFVRRVGWHVLDHIWEIEDRVM